MKKVMFVLAAACLLCGTGAFGADRSGNPGTVRIEEETHFGNRETVQGGDSKIWDDPVVDRILAIAAKDNRTMDHLDVMCNRFGGRLLGSAAYEDALEYAVHMFEEWGLEVHRDYVGELPVGFNRGPWFGRMIGAGNNEALHFTTPSYTAGTKGLQRGTVVREPRTRAEFERMKGTIKGAWVLIGGESGGWPIDYSPRGDSLRAEIIAKNEEIARQNNEIRMYNRDIQRQRAALEQEIKDNPKTRARNEAKLAALKEKDLLPLNAEPALFYKEMKEAGMLGIIQSSKVPIRTLYDRKNLEQMTWETLPTVPDIKLDENQFKVIADKVDRREYVQLEFDIRNHFRMGPIPYYSVVAILRGTELPDEYIFCSGHLDSYDVATGGVDCGTGIAPAMETARLLMAAGARPKRSIVFCLWAGEEFGLWGSRHWVESNPDKLPDIVNFFNRDGGPTVANSLSVPREWYDDLAPICGRVNEIDPEFPFTLRVGENYPMAIPETAGGSDHAYFAMSGVPVISFGTGDPKGYDFDYGEIWHTDRDLYTKSIPEYMEHTSVVNAIVFYGMANLERRLPAEAVYRGLAARRKDSGTQAEKAVSLHRQAADSVRILWIGNSYTYYNDVPKMVEDMGARNGVAIATTRVLKGGEKLSGHLQNPELHRQLEKGGWDYVVIQEFSSTPAYSTRYVAENILPYAAEIDSLVKKYSPSAETVYYMTWGHKNGNVRQTDYPLDDTYESMQQRIITTYTEMAHDNGGLLAPVGIAWRNVRVSHPEIELYVEDLFHPSLAGSYLAASTLFATMCGGEFVPIAVDGLDARTMRILHEESVRAVNPVF